MCQLYISEIKFIPSTIIHNDSMIPQMRCWVNRTFCLFLWLSELHVIDLLTFALNFLIFRHFFLFIF
jgi:hypothetical protein